MDFRFTSNHLTPVIKCSSSSKGQSSGFRRKLSFLLKFGRKSKNLEIDDVTRLVAGIEKLNLNSKFAMESAKTTQIAAKLLAKWAKKGRNSAIDDVMQKTSQLMQFHADNYTKFAKDYKLILKKLHKVGDTELRMKKPVKQLKNTRVQERQLQKKIRTLMANGEDTALLRRELDQTILARETAEQTLAKERAETEVVKMFQFREDIADAHRLLASRTLAIFNCQREIAQFVPEVSTQDVNQMMYDGAAYTQEHLDKLCQWMLNDSPGISPLSLGHISGVSSKRPTVKSAVIRREDIAPPPYSSARLFLPDYAPVRGDNHPRDGIA